MKNELILKSDLDVISIFVTRKIIRNFLIFLIQKTYNFSIEHENDKRYVPLVWYNRVSKNLCFDSAWVDGTMIDFIINEQFDCDDRTEGIVVELFRNNNKEYKKIIKRMLYVSIFGDLEHVTGKTFRGFCTTKNLICHQQLLKYKNTIVEFHNIPFFITNLIDFVGATEIGDEQIENIEKLVRIGNTYDKDFDYFGYKKISDFLASNDVIAMKPYRIKI